ncbi:MAG: HAMP domain-containing histidine kinase [Acholeplasmatales bacterium]|nr:HAMP domain-containing histidine kinase [Acholeplasmatales bacterium]
MKKRIFFISLFFILIISIITVVGCVLGYRNTSDLLKEEQLVNINEINQLINNGKLNEAKVKLNELDLYLRNISNEFNPKYLIIIGSLAILFIVLVFLYIYFSILRPFDKLKSFANEIALGNFDIPLNYDRSNYFGKFTWAFDSMRTEITKARKCETEAIENNKTIIASLSHDIKTPIASINAYAEALEANIDSSYEDRVKYLNVIMRKSQEVKKLTDDLFLHSVSDMDKISFIDEKLDLNEIIVNSIKDFKGNNVINLENEIKDCFIIGDKMRTYQIFENIINNSIKYANTNIDINMDSNDEYYIVNIKDYGPGISDSDMPFIFEKFYRGKNATGKNGTGLGLYIVKYMINKMDGKVELESKDGLNVKLFFKKIIS